MSANSGGLVRNALTTVARGFLLGVGFSLALGAAYYVSWQAFASNMSYDTTLAGAVSTKDFVLSNVEELKHDGLTTIIGSVKNSGSKPARGVEVQANLFDHGKFVDQYSTYLSGTLASGDSRYFKISCGCKGSPPATHDSFKVQVVGGF